MESSPEVVTKEEGLRLLKAGQVNEAIQVLEKVKTKGSEDAQVCAILGAAYNQKGDKLNAIAAFEESLRIEETPKSYYNLGLVYESVKRIDEAVREYRMALELDPNYSLARDAVDRLHNQYEALHSQAAVNVPSAPASIPAGPAAVPAAPAQPTQAMPAGPPPGSSPPVMQTQAFAGPPPVGPTIGQPQAPPPLVDPFAQPVNRPPTQQDFIAQQMAKQQAIADQQHLLMKNGVIYGAICGSIFFVFLTLAMGAMLAATMGGKGLVYFVFQALIGAGYGAMVGLWVGYTCGGESAGFQAGAVLGGVYGLIIGLIGGWPAGLVVIYVIFRAFGSGIIGYFIGKWVGMSIGD